MLTRHSPLHALGYAEAGWLVGESGGQWRHAGCWTTARVACSTTAQVRTHCVRGADWDQSQVASREDNRKKARELILGPCREDHRGRNGRPRPKTPNRNPP